MTVPMQAVNLGPERFCRSCRQSLRGVVSRRCPECGRAFDPDDPRTTSPHALREVWVNAAAASRLILMATAALASALILLSSLGFDLLWLFLAVLVLLPFMLFMGVAMALPIVPVRLRDRLLAPLAVIVVFSVLITHWPLRITFALHRPWLKPIADQVLQEGTLEGPHWVGIFRFQRIIMHPSGNVGFKLTGHSGGGMHLVRRQPDSRLVWYNAAVVGDFGSGWYLVHED